MYLPPAFREDSREFQFGLLRSHPLGLLVSAGPAGLLANAVPFIAYPEEGDKGVLRAHLARANAQWREFAAAPDCLVVFQGPQAYVSPTLYPTKQETHKVVPTWNYAVVQVRGRARAVEDAAWLRQQIEDLTRFRENGRPKPWRVSDAPADFIGAQIQAIVGLEIRIASLEGKWKMSQNRVEADRRGVAEGLAGEGVEAAQVAELVFRTIPATKGG